MARSTLRTYAFAACVLLSPIATYAGEAKVALLDIPGMNCSLCPITVKKALQRVPGYLDAEVDLDSKRARVRYDSDRVTPDGLASAVTNAGYPATVVQK